MIISLNKEPHERKKVFKVNERLTSPTVNEVTSDGESANEEKKDNVVYKDSGDDVDSIDHSTDDKTEMSVKVVDGRPIIIDGKFYDKVKFVKDLKTVMPEIKLSPTEKNDFFIKIGKAFGIPSDQIIGSDNDELIDIFDQAAANFSRKLTPSVKKVKVKAFKSVDSEDDNAVTPPNARLTNSTKTQEAFKSANPFLNKTTLKDYFGNSHSNDKSITGIEENQLEDGLDEDSTDSSEDE
jgi:hypothetical protein